MSRIGKTDDRARECDCARDPPSARRGEPSGAGWLEAKLKAIHDEVVHEPLPDTLRRLIDAIDR